MSPERSVDKATAQTLHHLLFFTRDLKEHFSLIHVSILEAKEPQNDLSANLYSAVINSTSIRDLPNATDIIIKSPQYGVFPRQAVLPVFD